MYIRVSVRTDAGVEFVKKESDNSYLIAVKVSPERGLANERVVELLRDHLSINSPSKGRRLVIRIASGHHSPHKLISIEEGQ
jgi:uncharacterized protein YggU (UPF0235/DUF167 family)